MWNKLQTFAQHPAVQFIKKLCGDPVQLYTILLMTSIMEYYHSSMNWLYTLLSVFISLGLMKFYEFVAKHRFIGPLCYLAFLMLGLCGVGAIISVGRQNYPIIFSLWFLTPQSAVDFSIWYTIAIYLLMMGFLSSAVFYFAKVRYRMVMQFLIMLIPLSLYAKEALQMPALLVILLLTSYFLLMVYCRQLRESTEIRRIHSFHGTVSITAYVLAFSILAAVVPKPNIKADREFIENAMGYSSWSDILLQAISVFNTSTDNSVMLSQNPRTIYYVKAPESMRLRTETYSYYAQDDTWNKEVRFDNGEISCADAFRYQPRALLQAILDAAKTDDAFADKYGLTELAETDLPAQELQEYAFFVNFSGTSIMPSPTRTAELESQKWQKNALISKMDVMFPNGYPITYHNKIGMRYYSDTYAKFAKVGEILGVLSGDTYAELLADAHDILKASDPNSAELLLQCSTEYAAAKEFLAFCEEMDYQSVTIDALAAEITEGCDSDIEKARAIENYFLEQNFVYDLTYQKADSENVDTFLTQTKRGVCYEFATAMILLCRSAGLPARYVEGFSLNEQYDNEIDGEQTNYLIKIRDSHAFPEVYIAGYGWLGFEPTVPSDEQQTGTVAENHYVMIWGFCLLGISLLAVGLYFLMPYLREQIFRRRLSYMTPPQAAAAVFRRMRHTLKLSESGTVLELAERSAVFLTEATNYRDFFAQLDVLLYDPEVQTNATTKQLAESYAQWQADRNAYLKAEKRKETKRNVSV